MVSRAGTGRTLIQTDSDADGKVGDAVFDAIGKPYTRGTARLAAADTDHSGTFVELLTAPAVGPRAIRIYDDNGDVGSLVSDNPNDDQFNAFPGNAGGVYVAVARIVSVVDYSDATTPRGIPDLGTVEGVIHVPASAGIIRDLDVTMNVAHTFDGDLDVTLVHGATGLTQGLFTDIGGTDSGLLIALNDEAGTDIGTADNPDDGPISGVVQPRGRGAAVPLRRDRRVRPLAADRHRRQRQRPRHAQRLVAADPVLNPRLGLVANCDPATVFVVECQPWRSRSSVSSVHS